MIRNAYACSYHRLGCSFLLLIYAAHPYGDDARQCDGKNPYQTLTAKKRLYDTET